MPKNNFKEWIEENHIVLTATGKHHNQKIQARAGSDEEVNKHVASLRAHVRKTGKTMRLSIHNTKTGEHTGYDVKAG